MGQRDGCYGPPWMLGQRERAPEHATAVRVGTDRATRAARVVLLAVPVAMILVLGWSRRWLNEDAYINLRVVDHVFAGNGPVFNAGERVEVATSPAWIWALCVARVVLGPFLRMEWVAIVASLAAAVGAFAIAARASRLLHGARAVVLPLGLIVVAAIPVVWDFATSGLEMGAVWLWTAGCWLTLVRASRQPESTEGRARVLSLVVLGFGPLVRPDLGVMSACLLAAWWAITRAGRGRVVRDLAIAAAVPVAYEVFRMGYYASVVPNTALAKDATGLHLRQGLTYLGDLVTTYWLWIPVAALAVVIAQVIADGDRSVRIACVGMMAAAATHAAYIVTVGGDYMHGRLLLPSLFAFALPASLELRAERVRHAVLAGAVGVWAAVCMIALRFEPELSDQLVADIYDYRAAMPADQRVTITRWSVEGLEFLAPDEIAALAEAGNEGFVRPLGNELLPADTGGRVVVMLGSIGAPAYRVGVDVWVVDIGGLGEPLAARTAVVPGRPAGHRKEVDAAWYEARWDVESPTDPRAVSAAEEALACGPIRDLLDAVNEPLTVGRFFSNMWNSVDLTSQHVPSDPRAAPTC
jgi:arabinofuranosyltransferase